MDVPPDLRRFAPATARNRGPILAVLERVLPTTGTILEVGAGTGEHAAFMAPRFPGVVWQPTDPDPEARASIDAWRAYSLTPNLRPARELDASSSAWPVDQVDALLAINVVHISPWPTTLGLFAGAGERLSEDGILFLYGPYRIGGEHTAPTNVAFDASLRGRDRRWGIRDLEALEELAAVHGLALRERVAMPANNFSLVFARA